MKKREASLEACGRVRRGEVRVLSQGAEQRQLACPPVVRWFRWLLPMTRARAEWMEAARAEFEAEVAKVRGKVDVLPAGRVIRLRMAA